jgi:acyl-CoA thioesterase FadM
MIHEVWSEQTNERAAILTGTMVAFDYTQNASIRVPDEWRERVAAFEPIQATS